LVVYLILYLFTSILTIFAWTYYIFLIVSFIVGVIYSGTSMCAFVLNYESSSKKMKSTFSTILSMSYGMGAIIHILIFYYYKNWIITVTITTILTIILLIFTFHLQESPEFLFVKGRYNEMIEVLKYIATMNGKQNELKEYLKNSTLNKVKIKSKIDLKDKHLPHNEKVYGVIDILFLKDQRYILLIMAFNWYVMTLTFYGINFNVTNFGTDPYSTGILIYLSETLSQWLCLYFINIYGFRLTLSGSYLLAAICLIVVNLLNNEYFFTKICLIFLAKFGISGVNISNYIFTAELFPFMIRVASMSFCSLMSRIGGMTGTLIIEVNSYSMLLFGSLCLLVSCILYRNQQLKNMEQLI
jgi:MFS family permease